MDSIIIILPTNATEADLNQAIKLAKEELQERRRQGANPTKDTWHALQATMLTLKVLLKRLWLI